LDNNFGIYSSFRKQAISLVSIFSCKINDPNLQKIADTTKKIINYFALLQVLNDFFTFVGSRALKRPIFLVL